MTHVQDVLSEEEFLDRNGASSLGFTNAALHKQPGATPKEIAKRAREQYAKSAALAERREVLRRQYWIMLEAGIIRLPTRIERLIKTAQGHEDNESVQAARRILAREGVWWAIKPSVHEPPPIAAQTKRDQSP